MKRVIIFKPKDISAAQKKALEESGFIVVIAANPKDVVVVDNLKSLSSDIVFEAALEALSWGNDNTCRNAFGNLLRKKIIEKHYADKSKS